MARIANKYLPIQQIDPQTPNLFLAQLIGAKDFRRDVLLRIIYDEQEWETALANAKKCAHLHHSNILQTLDVGQHNEFWYVAHEFLESLTLEEIILQKIQLNVEQIVYICTEILIALHYAQTQHAEPVYHHNLTPQKILITKQGSIKIRGFATRCILNENSPYRNPHIQEGQNQDMYGVGKLLQDMLSLSAAPSEDLYRIAQQACSTQKDVQFQSSKAMYDILLMRHPINGTVSVELAQDIVQQSFDEWEEQPTFISRTLTIKDTQVFIPQELFAQSEPETFPLATEEIPEQKKPSDPVVFWGGLSILFTVVAFSIGLFIGYTLHPNPTFKAMIPKGLSLKANGHPFSEISQQSLDREIKIEILQEDSVLMSTDILVEPNQNLIIILPLETSSKPPSP